MLLHGRRLAVAAICTSMGVFEPVTLTSLDKLEAAPWIRVPTPFQWGMPFTVVRYIASMVEHRRLLRLRADGRRPGARQQDHQQRYRHGGHRLRIAGIFGTGTASSPRTSAPA